MPRVMVVIDREDVPCRLEYPFINITDDCYYINFADGFLYLGPVKLSGKRVFREVEWVSGYGRDMALYWDTRVPGRVFFFELPDA